MYKIHLILKYLLKRRIAWVSLAAVALCTMMVLVVISIMGGWLNMFKSSFRGLAGDLVIHTDSLEGFRYYDEIIDALKKDPNSHVAAAVPSIETYGLLDYGNGPVPVRVMGMKIEEMGTVNTFPQSLYLQHTSIEARLKDSKLNLSPAERKELQHKLDSPPSFDLLDEMSVELDALPAGLKYATPQPGKELRPGAIELPKEFPPILLGWLRYDALRHNLLLRNSIPDEWRDRFAGLSADPAYKSAIAELFDKVKAGGWGSVPPRRGKAAGLIVGTSVIGLRKDPTGKMDRPGGEFGAPVRLTVLNLSSGELDSGSKVAKNYAIVDDSHLGVWQYDSMYVYVSFDSLQKDLGLDAQTATLETGGKPIVLPARATDIHIKVSSEINPNNESELLAVKKTVEDIVNRVTRQQIEAHGELDTIGGPPIVKTWQDTMRIWISAVEHEKLLLVILFGIMCVVAIFLIFCIFYMIVVEKTKDIGIIKSVGATSGGVAGIFLGYGLVIGIIGSIAGLVLSYLILHNINWMHEKLAEYLHIKIWDPQVYQFDKIPNTMSAVDIAWIIPIAILASILGALVPALRAAQMNPVEALRWE